MKNIASKLLLGTVLGLTATLAAAASSGSIGSASASDVTLNFQNATQLHYAGGLNPQSGGKTGGSFSFDGAFAGTGSHDWIRLGQFDVRADNGAQVSTSLLGAPLTISFDQFSNRDGTWALSNGSSTTSLKLDLVFAVHTGGGNGAFLFNDYTLGAQANHLGTYRLNMLNPGGALSGYSNLTLFARDASKSPRVSPGVVSAVPEPTTYAMLAVGLGLLGLMSRRATEATFR